MASGIAEFIAENFHSTVDLTWDLVGRRTLARFSVADGVKVEVQFEERQPGRWLVSFVTQTPPTAQEDYFRAFSIFNGVFQATEEFISVREPDAVIFAAKREELAHIYQTYLHREQSRIESLGYRLLPVRRIDPYTEYELIRRKTSRWKV